MYQVKHSARQLYGETRRARNESAQIGPPLSLPVPSNHSNNHISGYYVQVATSVSFSFLETIALVNTSYADWCAGTL
jgi:hypothetical protein